MSRALNFRTSVSALMGVPVADATGRMVGHVSEFAVAPTVDATHVQSLVLRMRTASRKDPRSVISVGQLLRKGDGGLQMVQGAGAAQMTDGESFLMLERDLLDQQIIDVHGHKVVRVNDVDMVWEMNGPAAEGEATLSLRIAEVEVGLRGALRRLLKGLPQDAVDRLACRIKPSSIPWDFVDLIDRDPSRRVRLKIEQERLAKMHPSDLADILEELAPAERQALFSSLDEEVAADTLEEVELKTQKTLIESLDSERVAGIIEEMDPGAAADLLSELSEERSDAILEEMNEKERHDVEELLDYESDSAAGLMTTDYVAVQVTLSVAEARAALQAFEGDVDGVTDVFLIDEGEHLRGGVPLAKLMLTESDATLHQLAEDHIVSSGPDAPGRKVAEQFDKYNLRCLPVLDAEGRLVGVIRAEQVIAWLRTKR